MTTSSERTLCLSHHAKMSLFRVLYRRPNHLSLLACRRASTVVASTATKDEITKKKSPGTFTFRTTSTKPYPYDKLAAPTTPISSCVENTKIEGVNYLKSQAPVLALPDDQYPEWLWTVSQPKVYDDEGPGSKSERAKRIRENKQKIKDKNFMSTQ